jgi:hypothetical protein
MRLQSKKRHYPEGNLDPTSRVAPREPRTPLQRDTGEARNQFVLFAQVLMIYLEHIDPAMHAHAKTVIRQCLAGNHSREPQLDYVIHTLKARLRATVGAYYWTRAEIYLKHLQQKCRDSNSTLDMSPDAAGLLLTSLSLSPPKIAKRGAAATAASPQSVNNSRNSNVKVKTSTNK